MRRQSKILHEIVWECQAKKKEKKTALRVVANRNYFYDIHLSTYEMFLIFAFLRAP